MRHHRTTLRQRPQAELPRWRPKLQLPAITMTMMHVVVTHVTVMHVPVAHVAIMHLPLVHATVAMMAVRCRRYSHQHRRQSHQAKDNLMHSSARLTWLPR
jgi:hypothetical protein